MQPTLVMKKLLQLHIQKNKFNISKVANGN